MILDDINRDQAVVVAGLYKYYTEKVNAGSTPEEANDFKDQYSLQENYFCDKDLDEFLKNSKVLWDKGYIDGDWDGEKVDNIRISQKGFDAVDTNLLSN
ncbi:hypothetical protein EIG98_12945 [Staphylococcus condimenti]|nr:hypothetical protein EIG98_12945 [Staphylococcus condimenti]